MADTFESYKNDLERSCGERVKEMVLRRADTHGGLSYEEFMELVRIAYPEG